MRHRRLSLSSSSPLLLGLLGVVPLVAVACGSSDDEGGATHTQLGDGGVVDGSGPKTDGGGAPNDASAGDGGANAPTWLAHRIQSPIPYTAPEYVQPYTNAFATPQIVGASRSVLYASNFDDESWQIVLQGLDGTSRKTLLASSATPGMRLQAFLHVPEQNAVLVLLQPAQDVLVSQLLSVPLDGSAVTTLDTNVLGVQVSADGTRVNYAKNAANQASYSLMTTLLATPAPQLLGTIAGFDYQDSAITRSRSSASNLPFFYFVSSDDEASDTTTATPFGQKTANAPATIANLPNDQATFAATDGTANGRFLSVAGSAMIDTQTGTTSTMPTFSPDRTRFASASATQVTLFGQDGTSHAITAAGVSALVWSADSKWALGITGTARTNCPYFVIDATANAVATHTDATCSLDPFDLAFTADDLSLVQPSSRNQAATLETITLATGVTHTLSSGFDYAWASASGPGDADPTNGLAGWADTGDGLVYPDGWGLWYAHYDGSAKVRLDTPRTSEPALTATSVPDYYGGTTGLIGWEPTSKTVVFEPVATINAALSSSEPAHSLATVGIGGGAETLLTTQTKTTGQILGFEASFAISDAFGKVLFNSRDGAFTAGDEVDPAILSIGDLAGGNALRLSPDSGENAGAPYGSGTMYSVGQLLGTGARPSGIVYPFYGASEEDIEVQTLSGAAPATSPGFTPRVVSPDGTQMIALGDNSSVSLLPLSPGSADAGAPQAIGGTFKLGFASECFGCLTQPTWASGDGTLFFTASSRALLFGSLTTNGPTSTYLVDLAGNLGTLTDLTLSAPHLLPDGLTVVGTASDGTLSTFSVTDPTTRTPRGKNAFLGSTADSGTVFLTNQATPVTLTAVRVGDGTVTNLIPSTLTGGESVALTSLSKDGTRVSYTYDARSSAPGALCNGYLTTAVIIGVDGSNPLTLAQASATCGQRTVDPLPSGTGFVYLEDQVLYASSGGSSSPLALSATGEKVQAIWVSPTSDVVVVQALNAQGTWTLYSVHPDGSARTALGETLPLQKQLRQLQFHAQGARIAVSIDALTDGVVELFDFPVQ